MVLELTTRRLDDREVCVREALVEHPRFDFDVEANAARIAAHEELGAHASDRSARAQLRLEARDANGAQPRVRVAGDHALDLLELGAREPAAT